MLTPRQYADYINQEIDAIKYPESPRGLYAPIAYTLDCGGKRLRPMLLMAAAEALGTDRTKVVSQALGIEMFHNFTLLHDDVMDRADLRRGKPTVHKKWDESTAILSGDAMLTMSAQLIGDCRSDKLADLLALFHGTAMEIYEGQQYDMDFETRNDVTVAEYMEMIRLKTSVLLGCACKTGALMAGADSNVCDAFYRYGISLGLAFQLQDDLLDTYGDPAVFGKNIGGDILNDKKTFLLITALNHANGSDRDTLLSLLGTRSDDKIQRVKAIYESTGAGNECRSLIETYTRDAIAELNAIEMDDEARNFFISLAEESINRKS